MGRVFVTQETQVDYSKAEAFGDLIPVTAKDVSNLPSSHVNSQIVKDAAKCLFRFDPDNDYLCITGSPYVGAICMWILGTQGVTKVRLLRWSGQDRKYYVVTVEL